MDENNAVSVLEELIETAKDGEKGYQDAAAHIKRPDLKSYFNEQALERSRFVQELQTELAKVGKPDKKASGSVSGALHRAWIDTKANLGGGDKTILEPEQQREDKQKQPYQTTEHNCLPLSPATNVRRQADRLQR